MDIQLTTDYFARDFTCVLSHLRRGKMMIVTVMTLTMAMMAMMAMIAMMTTWFWF